MSLPGHAPEIWALGLRNSWGMAFDQQTGDLYIPDTGWYTNEEVNFQPADSRGVKITVGPCWKELFPLKRREPLMILSGRWPSMKERKAAPSSAARCMKGSLSMPTFAPVKSGHCDSRDRTNGRAGF